MPARSKVTDDEIYDALVRTRGAVNAAANLLHISTRTLQRRVKSNPNLRLYPAEDHSFRIARSRRGEAEKAASAAQWLGTSGVPWAKYHEEAEWQEGEVELEPQVLEGYRLRDFLARLRSGELMRVNVKRAPARGRRR